MENNYISQQITHKNAFSIRFKIRGIAGAGRISFGRAEAGKSAIEEMPRLGKCRSNCRDVIQICIFNQKLPQRVGGYAASPHRLHRFLRIRWVNHFVALQTD